jgi:hypothetical protein
MDNDLEVLDAAAFPSPPSRCTVRRSYYDACGIWGQVTASKGCAIEEATASFRIHVLYYMLLLPNMKIWFRLAVVTFAIHGGFAALSTIVLAQNFVGQFPLHKQTKYFDFHYKRDSSSIAGIVRFDDAFIQLVDRDFFKADFDYPIRAFVLEDQNKFKEFMQNDLHIPGPPVFGIYLYSDKLFATYETSGLGTFTHEIMHPLVERNLTSRPQWASEGIPTFFEKFYGYWKGDELVLFWGFQNPWRIESLGTNLTRLNLRAIISDQVPTDRFGTVERNESELRMVSLFLWEQGRFRRFLRLVAAKDKRGYASYFEAAMEMPLERIIPLWQDYLHDVARKRTAILSLPLSTVLDSEPTFRSFAEHNGISTEQAKQLD